MFGVMSDGKNDLLTTTEVAVLFRVDPKSVMRWVRSGRLEAIRTPGGAYRFERATIERLAVPVTGPRP
jgi:excisionase family DNA binding protein